MSSKKYLSAENLGFQTEAQRLIDYLEGKKVLTHKKAHKEDEPMLSEHLAEKLDRVITTRSLIMEHKIYSRVARVLEKTYNYSQATAYRDIRLTELVFGNLVRASKDMKRAIAEEMIIQSRDLAIAKEDTRSLAAIDKNYIALHGLDKEEGELPDLSSFEFQPIIVAVIPEQVGYKPPKEEDLRQRFSDWAGAEDVDFEDLSHA